MKQVWPNYSYSPTTNVLTLTGLNIDRDQLLLVTAADRGRIMYNFADSSVTASAFTSGANTALTLVATTAGLTTTAALVIYFDDQLASTTVTVSSLPAISGTVTANLSLVGGLPNAVQLVAYNDEDLAYYAVAVNTPDGPYIPTRIVGGTVTIGSALPAGTARIGTVTVGNISSLPDSDGNAVVRNFVFGYDYVDDLPVAVAINGTSLSVAGSVQISSSLPAGTNRIGVVTIGAGTVTIGAGTAQIGSVTASISNFPATQAVSLTTLPALVAGTAQIGSVTASISGTVPISISSVTVGNSVTIGSLPALAAGTAQIGSVTASISNTAITVYSAQGTTVTNSNFTSTTASTTLVSAVAGRDVLTVFNEGAGNLFISPGATATTISYQVRLSAGDYWECPEGQRSLIHTAVFATAGTARVTEVS
jgi:hypothetical protein